MKKNQLFLLLLFLIIARPSSAQGFLDGVFDIKVDAHLSTDLNFGVGVGLGLNGVFFLTGDVTGSVKGNSKNEILGDVAWDEREDEVVSSGKYTIYPGLGFMVRGSERLWIGPNIGFGILTEWKDCYDPTGLTGDNGHYYKERKIDNVLDVGLRVNYVIKEVTLGVGIASRTGTSFSIGLLALAQDR